MKQYGTLEKMLPVIPFMVNNLLKKYQKYVWYQYDISLADNSLVGLFQFVSKGRKKLKYPNMIEEKQWKELYKEEIKGVNTYDAK